MKNKATVKAWTKWRW